MLASLRNLGASLAFWTSLALLAANAPALASPLQAPGDIALDAAGAGASLLLRAHERRSSPIGSYAPALVPCPAVGPDTNVGLLRNASNYALSNAERAYIERHRALRAPDWADYLRRVGLDGDVFPGGAANFTRRVANLPRAGLAVSGGGYRAMLVGGGMVQAFDGRNATAVERGTGGILQLVDYMAGLSGGSWLTGTLAINDHQTVQSLHDTVWDLESNLIIPEDNTITFFAGLVKDVSDKADVVGRDFTSITDYWANALRQKMVISSYPDEGVAVTWSDIRNTSSYRDSSYPFPIIIAAERVQGEILISLNSSIWEFTPVEFGNWLPTNAAFLPIDAFGTNLTNGVSQERDGQCYAGYDNFGYAIGTSSSLFTGLFTSLIQSNGSSIIKDALLLITGTIAAFGNDVAQIANPLRGYGNSNSTAPEKLTMVDGGLDLQNVPFWPVLQPARDLDVVIAIDSSADVTGWPNGTAPNATATRGRNPFFSNVPVPNFPTPETFVNRGLNTRPTFFACNASDAINAGTAANGTQSPLVVYLPNYPWLSLGNASTYKLAYTKAESQSIIDNAFAAATLNGTEPDWPQCLACAMLERTWARSGLARPQNCSACLSKYCWDGTTNETTPANPYSPPVGVPAFVSSGGQTQAPPPYTGGDGSNQGPDSANAQSQGGGSGGGGTASTGGVARALRSGTTSVAVLSTAVLAAALGVLVL